MKLKVATDRPGPLAIHEMLQRHADSLWIPEHLTAEQAAGFVLDHFHRQIESELAMVKIERQ